MYKQQVTLLNPTGLHARPASEFVRLAATFKSDITIARAGGENAAVNAKSIVFLLSLGLCQNTQVEICAKGPDEEAAVKALVSLIQSGFGE